MHNVMVPGGAWVLEKNERLVVVFPADTVIQGHLCLGGGGSAGTRTSFYPSGKLQYFYANGVADVQGVKCKGGTMNLISLFEDGSLRQCTLAEEHLFNDIMYRKGTKVTFDQTGAVVKTGR